MPRKESVALIALLSAAVVLRVLRRGRARPEQPAPADEPALADAAESIAEDELAVQEGVDVDVVPEPSSTSKPWTALIPDTLQPYAYVRLAQVFMALLTVVGSAVNGMTFARGQPIVGIILTIGVLHISALEALLQAMARARVRQPAQQVRISDGAPVEPGALAAPEPDAAAAAAVVLEPAAPLAGIPAAMAAVLPYSADQISGLWIKDRKRSSSMAPMCDAMHMYGLLRQAIKILKGTDLRFTATNFDVMGVSVIPLLKIAERYPLDGTEVKNRRRDQRRGGCWGRAEATPDGMLVHYRWGDPYPGEVRELYRITASGEMHIVADGSIEGTPCSYTLIHRRPGAVVAT